MARPTKFSTERTVAIIKSLAIGGTRRDAAHAAGVDYTTFLNWIQAGEKAGSGKFFEFFKIVERTEAEVRLKFISVVARAASEGDARVALEYLKRRDREHWGDNVDVTSGGEAISIVRVGIDPDKV